MYFLACIPSFLFSRWRRASVSTASLGLFLHLTPILLRLPCLPHSQPLDPPSALYFKCDCSINQKKKKKYIKEYKTRASNFWLWLCLDGTRWSAQKPAPPTHQPQSSPYPLPPKKTKKDDCSSDQILRPHTCSMRQSCWRSLPSLHP